MTHNLPIQAFQNEPYANMKRTLFLDSSPFRKDVIQDLGIVTFFFEKMRQHVDYMTEELNSVPRLF